MKNLFLFIIILLIPSTSFAKITRQGRGMLFGDNHSFFVTAAPTWVLDNQSAINQGIHMAFYPLGKTWENSPVIAYGKSVPKSDFPTIESFVNYTIDNFKNNGSKKYQGEKKKIIKLSDGKKAVVYHYWGDQWGNFEAVGYIAEKETINFVVFNSRKKIDFEKYLKDFYVSLETYKNVYTPKGEINKSAVEKLIKESDNHLKTDKGKKYETETIKAIGEKMGDSMGSCASYLSNEKLENFRLFVRIDSDGYPSNLTVFPSTSLSVCFKALMSTVKYPAHNLDPFLLNIEMMLTE